jgi:hypothetical protein
VGGARGRLGTFGVGDVAGWCINGQSPTNELMQSDPYDIAAIATVLKIPELIASINGIGYPVYLSESTRLPRDMPDRFYFLYRWVIKSDATFPFTITINSHEVSAYNAVKIREMCLQSCGHSWNRQDITADKMLVKFQEMERSMLVQIEKIKLSETLFDQWPDDLIEDLRNQGFATDMQFQIIDEKVTAVTCKLSRSGFTFIIMVEPIIRQTNDTFHAVFVIKSLVAVDDEHYTHEIFEADWDNTFSIIQSELCNMTRSTLEDATINLLRDTETNLNLFSSSNNNWPAKVRDELSKAMSNVDMKILKKSESDRFREVTYTFNQYRQSKFFILRVRMCLMQRSSSNTYYMRYLIDSKCNSWSKIKHGEINDNLGRSCYNTDPARIGQDAINLINSDLTTMRLQMIEQQIDFLFSDLLLNTH